MREVHRAQVGDELTVGLLGGKMGRGRVLRLDDEALELALTLDQAPPPKLPLTLVIAVPPSPRVGPRNMFHKKRIAPLQKEQRTGPGHLRSADRAGPQATPWEP